LQVIILHLQLIVRWQGYFTDSHYVT